MTYGGLSPLNRGPHEMPLSTPAIIVGAMYRLTFYWNYDPQVQTITARAMGPGKGSGIAWQPEPMWQQGALPGPVDIIKVERI